MKEKIHPPYFPKAMVSCACGQKFAVGSTNEKISVEICSACHPFFTGGDKIVDTAGRVEKFKARQAAGMKSVKSIKSVKSVKSVKS